MITKNKGVRGEMYIFLTVEEPISMTTPVLQFIVNNSGYLAS